MVLRADLLMEKVQKDLKVVAQSKFVGWNFGDIKSGGIPITSAKISWPAATYDIDWSPSQARWLVSNNGVANMSSSGIQHGPTTFIIQIVEISPSEYGDKFGGVTPYSATVGSGRGFILRDGRYFSANWNRPDEMSGTKWTDSAGTQIPFARGQVWIALTEKDPQFALDLRTEEK